MNSTLGSVVPLAMFVKLPPQPDFNAAVRFYDQYSNFDVTKLVKMGITRGC